ncbi:hypothetical protein J6590_065488 [Homalodisca vitripennis]|nr:hypothetical protein J6590_065488 [Homalodisca vitripennis]
MEWQPVLAPRRQFCSVECILGSGYLSTSQQHRRYQHWLQVSSTAGISTGYMSAAPPVSALATSQQHRRYQHWLQVSSTTGISTGYMSAAPLHHSHDYNTV